MNFADLIKKIKVKTERVNQENKEKFNHFLQKIKDSTKLNFSKKKENQVKIEEVYDAQLDMMVQKEARIIKENAEETNRLKQIIKDKDAQIQTLKASLDKTLKVAKITEIPVIPFDCSKEEYIEMLGSCKKKMTQDAEIIQTLKQQNEALEKDQRINAEKLKANDKINAEISKEIAQLREEKSNFDNVIKGLKKENTELTEQLQQLQFLNQAQTEYVTKLEKVNKEQEEKFAQKIKDNQLEQKDKEFNNPYDNNEDLSKVSVEDRIQIKEKSVSYLNSIISDYLYLIDMNQYSVNIFEMIDFIVNHLEELEKSTNNPYSLLKICYNNMKYFILENRDTTFENYLSNTSLQTQRNLNVDAIKKVKFLNDKNSKIYQMFREKKNALLQSGNLSFNMIKEFVLKSETEELKEKIEEVKSIFEYKNKILFIDYNKRKEGKEGMLMTETCEYFYQYYFSRCQGIVINFLSSMSPSELEFLFTSMVLNSKGNINSLKFVFDAKVTFENPAVLYLHSILANLISFFSSCTELCFENFPLISDFEIITPILDSLQHSNIEKLSMINCLSKDCKIFFVQYIANNSKLKEINLSNNPINLPSSLGPVLPTAELKRIIITNSKLNDADFSCLFDYVGKSKTLELVDISNNPISISSSMFIEAAMGKTSVKVIKMNKCSILYDKINALPKENKSIFGLFVDDNNFSDAGIIGLSQFVRGNENLKVLSCNNCQITGLGFNAFLENLLYAQCIGLKIFLCKNNCLDKETSQFLISNKDLLQSKKFEFTFTKEPKMMEKIGSLSFIKFNE